MPHAQEGFCDSLMSYLNLLDLGSSVLAEINQFKVIDSDFGQSSKMVISHQP